jgi:hypothetical protein
MYVLLFSNISEMITSKRMRWMSYVAHMGMIRNAYKILVRKSEGKKPLGDLGNDGIIILNGS